MKPSEMSDEELTRAVAMEVMGLSACDLEIQDFHSGLITIAPGWHDKEGNQQVAGFAPLTDANHERMVVERMRELGWHLFIEPGAPYYPKDKTIRYDIGFVRWNPYHIIQHYRDEIDGRAVCEAALAAVLECGALNKPQRQVEVVK